MKNRVPAAERGKIGPLLLIYAVPVIGLLANSLVLFAVRKSFGFDPETFQTRQELERFAAIFCGVLTEAFKVICVCRVCLFVSKRRTVALYRPALETAALAAAAALCTIPFTMLDTTRGVHIWSEYFAPCWTLLPISVLYLLSMLIAATYNARRRTRKEE